MKKKMYFDDVIWSRIWNKVYKLRWVIDLVSPFSKMQM